MTDYQVGSIVFHDWKIVRKLGEGANGIVFGIGKEEFGINVKSALKVIRIPKTDSEVKSILNDGMDEESVVGYFRGFVDEIVKEIAIMTSLKNHPNIVGYEDHNVIPHEDGIGWDILIRMELLTPLGDWQLKHGMDGKETIELGKQICSALSFCEKKNLMHRDIKPENLFVDELGTFKLGDFGIARTMEKTSGGLSRKGTESYMAPEVYLGKPYGPTVDMYSLGLVLYKMVNRNRLPFYPPAPQMVSYSDRENALASRMMGKEFPAPVDASPGLTEVIRKACAFDPAMRYQSADEMLQALCNIRETEKKTAGRPLYSGTGAGEHTIGMDSYAEDSTVGMSSYAEGSTVWTDSYAEDNTVGMGSYAEESTVGMGSYARGRTSGTMWEQAAASEKASEAQPSENTFRQESKVNYWGLGQKHSKRKVSVTTLFSIFTFLSVLMIFSMGMLAFSILIDVKDASRYFALGVLPAAILTLVSWRMCLKKNKGLLLYIVSILYGGVVSCLASISAMKYDMFRSGNPDSGGDIGVWISMFAYIAPAIIFAVLSCRNQSTSG